MTFFQPLHDFAKAIVEADPANIAKCFVDSPTIIDDIPRHFWSGPEAIAQWSADARLVGGQQGPAQLSFRFEMPLYADIHGEPDAVGSTGYVAARCVYGVTRDDSTTAGNGLNTFALRREESGWKILSWTFTHTGGHRRPISQSDLLAWDGE